MRRPTHPRRQAFPLPSPTDSAEGTPGSTARKSSAALREQIAKARAAKKATSRQVSVASTDILGVEPSPLVPTDNTFDFGLESDPFNQRGDQKSQAKILQRRLASARTSGRLNIAAMNLREIPADVMNMYSLESLGANDGSWAESVDLTRFVAADNELGMIADSVFPDTDPQVFSEEEESQGNIFGGLETLDLHGNMLIAATCGSEAPGAAHIPQSGMWHFVLLLQYMEVLICTQSQNRLAEQLP